MTEKKTPRKSPARKTVAKKAVPDQTADVPQKTRLVDQPIDLSDHPAVEMGLIRNPGDHRPDDAQPMPSRRVTQTSPALPGNPKRGDGSKPES